MQCLEIFVLQACEYSLTCYKWFFAITKKTTKGGFLVIAQTSRSHVFTKEINHASTRNQYLNGNFYCKNRLRAFSAMTEKPALIMDDFILF